MQSGVRSKGGMGNKMITKEASWKPLTASRMEEMLLEPHSVGGCGERETTGLKKL